MQLFKEYQNLITKTPLPQRDHALSQNNRSTFGCYISQSSNIYFGFDVVQSHNSYFIFDCKLCSDCMDCTKCDKSEKCYECNDCYKCYDTNFSNYCKRCTECYFCSRCVDCMNCFGCTHLSNKQYCIFNKQYSKQEYKRRTKELMKLSPDKILKRLQKLEYNYPLPHIYQHLGRQHNVNSPYGNYIYRGINSYYCFDCIGLTDSGYIYDSNFMENSWDCSRCLRSTDCYECLDTTDSNNSAFLIGCSKCSDCMHCYWCNNCQDCTGCVLLENKHYCVLNRQLDKQTFEEVKQLLKQDINTDLGQYLNNNDID